MKQTKPRNNRRWLWLSIAAAVILILALLEVTNTTHILHKQKVPAVIPTHSSASTASNGSPASGSDQTSGNSSQSQPNDSAPAADHDLIAPTGNFVSNHFPGQNNSPTTENSTCNTTPGASCTIMFTNLESQQTTQLPAQITDQRGSTNWYWDVKQDAHLTSGRWKVTAAATLNGQTKTTDDALNLTIQ